MSEQFIYSQKNNFSGGELTPTIEGRTELGLYQNGVKKLINFMLLPSGGIMRRHGTQFVHLFEHNVPKKMVSVMFSRKLSYLLVFEAHPLKTTCSFFVGGELFLTTKTLKDGNHDFHFRPQDFSCCCFQGVAYINFGAKYPVFKFSVDPEIIERFDQYLKDKAGERQRQGEEAIVANAAAIEIAATFPDKERMFIIEPLKAHVNYFKELETNKLRPFNEVIYNAEIDKINDELKAIYQRANQNIYERREELLYCTSVAAFENRLWCFGASKNIHQIWASYKGDFVDLRMAYKTLLEARNPLTAFSATFSSSTFDDVLWSVPFSNELLLGTTDGIYLVKEGDRSKGEFVKINKEIDLPVSPINPVVLGKTIFFVEGNNRKINSLFYSQEKGGFQVSDITPYAEHIFADGIKEIAGVNSPFSIIFAVLKNGSFASFTYSHDLKIMGWSQHFLGGNGFVLGITPVYGDYEDKLYFHVRREGENGSYKEYLEVLLTGYFSAKLPEMHKPVYADCHININNENEHVINEAIKQAIKDDSSTEFRGDITKLEQIIQIQAENVFKLNLDPAANDFGNKFEYRGKPIVEYEGERRQAIEQFLKEYYKNYLPIIFETLAAAFAYLRIMGRLYVTLENIFCGEPDQLAEAEQLLDEAETLGGDVINNVETVIRHWQIPDIVNDGGLMEYLPNNGFSFYPNICSKLKTLNTMIIRTSFNLVKEIIKLTKEAIEPQFEADFELQEMRASTAKLNKILLQYYAQKNFDNKQELLVSLKKFFTLKTINFYNELLNITHPTLTKYLFSAEAKELIIASLNDITEHSSKEQLTESIDRVIKQLIAKLEACYIERKIDEIISSKRKEEIVAIIRSITIAKRLNQQARNYILSNELINTIQESLEAYEATSIGAAARGHGHDYEVASIASVGSIGAESEHDEDSTAVKVAKLMQDLSSSIKYLRRSLIDHCCLLMPLYHPSLLANILEDEKTIKLEKYLFLSKKYFSVFKKLFPDIGINQLGIIARNCQPSFDQIRVGGILPIFQKMIVSIIGDEELQDLKVLTLEQIKLKHPVRYLSIGFPYSSVMQTFPFIFPDELEHMPKMDVGFGLKIYNTKGGYFKQKNNSGDIEKQHINSRYVDSDELTRFANEKKYLATLEACNALSTPYQSGWVEFQSIGQVKTDIDFTFIVDKPYPASILKIYAKAKILPYYKR